MEHSYLETKDTQPLKMIASNGMQSVLEIGECLLVSLEIKQFTVAEFNARPVSPLKSIDQI